MTGPDGAPLRAAFVQARHGKLKMTVSVLTDNAGRYAVENLPAGEYRLSVRALGTKAEPRSGITLAADGTAAHDFALQSAPVRWSDLTILQGLQLLPEARGKQTLFDNCLSCHGFQSKMAAVTTDEDGWRTRVEFMREAMRSSLADRAGFSDAQADEVVSYLTHVFGEASVLPKSPTELAAYATPRRRSTTRRSTSSMSISKCRGPIVSPGPRIPTPTAISGSRNTGCRTGSRASIPRAARSRSFASRIRARR